MITRPPIWCSVDLRDGNQALIEPMDAERKLRMFQLLVTIGFKEIEIGFPSASQTDFDFVRQLIEENLIPDDVTVQVLTQARDDAHRAHVRSLRGAKRAIVHLYNSTSTTQRRVVFRLDRAGISDIAVKGARTGSRTAPRSSRTPTGYFQYSPESFTGTELDFAVEICDAVMRRLAAHAAAQGDPQSARHGGDGDAQHLRRPDRMDVPQPRTPRQRRAVSVHPHNDRGTGVAAAELAMMAGADRVEGTLFGNGERTGNVDIVTLALNLYTQGVDPSSISPTSTKSIRTVEHCNQLPVHPRHPYVGDLVFTAFSGSHQDAIKKGLAARTRNSKRARLLGRAVPADRSGGSRPHLRLGHPRQQPVGQGRRRLSSRARLRLALPRRLQIEFSQVVQQVADSTGKELGAAEIRALFEREYVGATEPVRYIDHRAQHNVAGGAVEHLMARLAIDGVDAVYNGAGNGPVDAFVHALREDAGFAIHVHNYHEHGVGTGEDATAVAYVQLRIGSDRNVYGVGLDGNIVTATLRAVLSAVNRGVQRGWLTLPRERSAVTMTPAPVLVD